MTATALGTVALCATASTHTGETPARRDDLEKKNSNANAHCKLVKNMRTKCLAAATSGGEGEEEDRHGHAPDASPRDPRT